MYVQGNQVPSSRAGIVIAAFTEHLREGQVWAISLRPPLGDHFPSFWGDCPTQRGERWYTQTVGARPCGSLRAQGVQGCHYGQCTQVLGHVFRVRVAFDTELRVPLSSSFSFLFLFFLVSNLGNPPPTTIPPPLGRRPPPPWVGGGGTVTK